MNRTDDASNATTMRARWRFPAEPFGSIPIGQTVERPHRVRPAATGGLEVRDVTLVFDGETVLLQRVSFSARPGTLTAVIGPSGAGKSTLARVVAGEERPTSGTVSFEGRGMLDVCSDVGMVPQNDVVHGRLSVAQALQFAAELRMPADTTASERERVVATVLEELELAPHAGTRIDKLSGGQRKRVSVAVELLTSPSLLVLDEPTTGLDPALDRSVMQMLRRLADAGRVVVVVTHSLTFLDMCDQVLLLAPGGKTAFCGRPEELNSSVGASDWADIFAKVCADPDGMHRRFVQGRGSQDADTVFRVAPAAPTAEPGRAGVWRQVSTVARRQVRLLMANRGYVAFLAVVPFIVGLLPLTVTGHAGLEPHAIAWRTTIRSQAHRRVDELRGDPDGNHTHRARSGRRTRCLPSRTGGGIVGVGIPAREDDRLQRSRGDPICDPRSDRHGACDRQAGPVACSGFGQPDLRIVRRCRSDMRGGRRSGACGFGSGADRRSGHRAVGDDADGATGARGRLHPGDGSTADGGPCLAHAGTMGLRGKCVDGRSDQPRRGDCERFALAAHHVGVAHEHGHVGSACHALRRRHTLAPQTLRRAIVTRSRRTPAGRRAEAQSGCGAARGSTTSR